MASYDLGRVMRQTFDLIKGSLPSVGLFLLVTTIITNAANWGMQTLMVAEMSQAMTPGTAPGNAAAAMFGSKWYWLNILVPLAIGAFSYAGSLTGMLQLAQGRAASLGGCLSAGFAKLAPMLGLTLLYWIAVVFGLLLLIVPGILLIVIWAVAMPALIGENGGVIESFSRSRDLTRGHRWMVLVTLIIALIMVYVPLLALGGAAMMGGSNQFEALRSGQLSGAMLAASVIYGWGATMFAVAIATAMYRELVQVKEGGTGSELQQVFD